MAAPAALVSPGELIHVYLWLMAGTATLNWASRAGYRRLFRSLHGTAFEPQMHIGCNAISVAYGAVALSFTYALARLLIAGPEHL
jgi:hypothetical protein